MATASEEPLSEREFSGFMEAISSCRGGSEDEPVGLVEIAGLLGVKRQTADNWQQRGVLPRPRWTVGGRPAWSWQRDVEPWARQTGRLQ